MKVIPENTSVSISASTENANYPAVNMLNNSPKKKWQGIAITPEVISLGILAGATAIAFFNINNISSLQITSLDYYNYEWGDGTVWGDGTEWASLENANINETITISDENASEWIEFLPVLNGTDIEITAIGGQQSIGIISSGYHFKSEDPSPEWSYGFADYSIVTELSNGSFDVRDRDTVRAFSGQFYMDTDPDFFEFSSLVRNKIKMNPAAWYFASKYNNSNYLIYGRFTAMPNTTMTALDKSNKAAVSISIIEDI